MVSVMHFSPHTTSHRKRHRLKSTEHERNGAWAGSRYRQDKLAQLCEQINTASGSDQARPYVHDVTDFTAVSPLFTRNH